jgi:hypothetical protein
VRIFGLPDILAYEFKYPQISAEISKAARRGGWYQEPYLEMG